LRLGELRVIEGAGAHAEIIRRASVWMNISYH
jgi:hypothetical protein